MIFLNKDNKLMARKEIKFNLEKDLQNLVEKNLDEVLNLKFLKTEFSIESYRFDTVAYNEDSNSFVIIEYKRGKNESLVDQGYAYLYTLLNRKADFVLLYNEVLKESKGINDFDWSQTRIVFISPQFTNYQKNATAFINMPFELYEVKQYEGGIVSVNQVNKNTQKDDTANTTNDDKLRKVNKEIIVYTEEDELKNGSDTTREWYEELKTRILELGNIKIEPKKLYIAFKGKTNICDFIVRKEQVKILINLKEGELKDPQNLARTVTNIGHWGNGDYEITIRDSDSFDYIMTLIKQSYESNR